MATLNTDVHHIQQNACDSGIADKDSTYLIHVN